MRLCWSIAAAMIWGTFPCIDVSRRADAHGGVYNARHEDPHGFRPEGKQHGVQALWQGRSRFRLRTTRISQLTISTILVGKEDFTAARPFKEMFPEQYKALTRQGGRPRRNSGDGITQYE